MFDHPLGPVVLAGFRPALPTALATALPVRPLPTGQPATAPGSPEVGPVSRTGLGPTPRVPATLLASWVLAALLTPLAPAPRPAPSTLFGLLASPPAGRVLAPLPTPGSGRAAPALARIVELRASVALLLAGPAVLPRLLADVGALPADVGTLLATPGRPGPLVSNATLGIAPGAPRAAAALPGPLALR